MARGGEKLSKEAKEITERTRKALNDYDCKKDPRKYCGEGAPVKHLGYMTAFTLAGESGLTGKCERCHEERTIGFRCCGLYVF